MEIQLNSEETICDSEVVILNEAKRQLIEYFGGKRKSFDLALDIPGTAYMKVVYQCLRNIEYGCTKSYQEIAIESGNGKAVRAIGMINHRNQIPIVIPCHRVIGKNKKMVGFAGGIWMKEALLALEKRQEYHRWINECEELIYSFGVVSDEYYDQDVDEEVELILGSATLLIEDKVVECRVGEKIYIKAHQKHRVLDTSWDCVWKCYYFTN